MYEDAWYSFVPELQQHKRGNSQQQGHRRRESLLQQPNGSDQPADAPEPLEHLYEEDQDDNGPPEAALARRAKSYSDFYDIVKEHIRQDAFRKKRRKAKDAALAALLISDSDAAIDGPEDPILDTFKDELLEASQRDYLIYRDQLAMTERHLETLIDDTNSSLSLLTSLATSFREVEEQTKTFQAQCDDLLSEQKRLQSLADEVGTDLHYYAYLDDVTRRLNAPGASRLVDDDMFGKILASLDSCIAFMLKNPTYRDADSYLARYQALLTKALHLLEVGFTHRLNAVSSEVADQVAATQSESARHAIAYGRFEGTMLESYSLIPNIQRVVYKTYDQLGTPRSTQSFDIYANTTKNIFASYLAARDRDLKPMTHTDSENLKTEAKSASAETACRNFIKQCYERSYDEAVLFTKMFGIKAQYSSDAHSVFTVLKSYRSDLVNGANITPVATNLQSVLAPTDLRTICNVVEWMTNEYLIMEYDEDETAFTRHCRELTARLLTEHLWTFVDAVFEAEIAKSISKVPVMADALKVGPVVNGVASSNAYPPVKRALELLLMFDQSMPKERCQGNSPIVFKIVRESIQALQRAEARIKSTKNGTDPDLFMIKNLLILRNELVSLEIGDIHSQEAGGMQHFGQIWDTLSLAQNLVGYLGSFIPGSSFWSRGSSPAANSAGAAASKADQDANERLDELLRRSIYAFTQRWGAMINDAMAKRLGGKNLVKIERDLDELLQRAFSNQPEVIAKLKEAIQINAQAQNEQNGNKITRV